MAQTKKKTNPEETPPEEDDVDAVIEEIKAEYEEKQKELEAENKRLKAKIARQKKEEIFNGKKGKTADDDADDDEDDDEDDDAYIERAAKRVQDKLIKSYKRS